MSMIIPLDKGKETIVDDEDYEYLNQWKWYCSTAGYANRATVRDKNYKQKKILIHRVIMKAPKNLQVDHINGNRLDNRKENLRIVTKQQNHMNRRKLDLKKSSKFKGVSYYSLSKKWVATIYFKNKRFHLGYFDNEIDAAKEYNTAAKKIHGEYARLNEL
jgi:hypothetical protein